MNQDTTLALYRLLCALPRYNEPVKGLPGNGIYVFFEKGETLTLGSTLVDRIVRIGTHKADGRFPGRIRDHYRGNRAGSVFRRHLGNAILRRADQTDVRLATWAIQKGEKLPTVEEMVSETLRSCFTYTFFQTPTKDERLELESGLIAYLAQHLSGTQSSQWLGNYALDYATGRPKFSDGLWNVNEVGATPLSDKQLIRVEALVSSYAYP